MPTRLHGMDITFSDTLTEMVGASQGLTLADQVQDLTRTLLAMPQVKCEVIHRFAPGLYIRELSMPAGVMAVGHRQRFEHLNVLLKGRVTVMNDDGTTTELVAPMMFVGKPGKRVGIVTEDMVWQNIYATNETDVEKLEAMFLDKDDLWRDHLAAENLLALPDESERQDYAAMLAEFGVQHEFARAESERADNMTDLPTGSYKVKVGDSRIEGKGLFATADIQPDEVICPGRLGDLRTIAGRYTNHSPRPNARPVRYGATDIYLVATRPIAGCLGGHDGEEITIDYREAMRLAQQINQEKLPCPHS